MSSASNKFFAVANPLLLVLALFNIALTIYGCVRYHAYLPTSDTWVYVDFLAEAGKGNLDAETLFDKHNGVHVIALPKLIYFIDAWLTRASGGLVTAAALLAQSISALLVWQLVMRLATLRPQEKYFLGISAAILLLSAAQAESLMNPANLQWALLVFAAVFTAWYLAKHLEMKSFASATGLVAGIALVGLSSASPLLALIPLLVVFISWRPGTRLGAGKWLLLGIAVSIGWVVANVLVADLPQQQRYETVVAAGLSAWNIFADFVFPPVERVGMPLASAIAGGVVLLALAGVVRAIDTYRDRDLESVPGAFLFLLLFGLMVIAAVALTRFYDPNAFTYRFVNIGLLFLVSLCVLMYAVGGQETIFRKAAALFTLLSVLSVTVVNITESAAFAYGRNHVRLNQVAYALDVEHSPVVSALPGTLWEKQDYDFVQANKHKLQQADIGIYADFRYRQVGQAISAVAGDARVGCEHSNIKIRRLVPERGFYKLSAHSRTSAGKTVSAAYFVDAQGVIRGFAIPVVPARSLWQTIMEGDSWAGFVNLERGEIKTDTLAIYAHSGNQWCEPQRVTLPEYRDPRKKSAD